MKNPLFSARVALLSIAIWAGSGGLAQAEKADRDKPMNIEADTLRYDDLRQTSLFTGNVVVTKGTLLIRGARVEVRQDASGAQYGVATAPPGQRAYFRQKREGLDETIEGEAETIEYDGRQDSVKLIQRAVLKRYRGSTLLDETTGSVINYDNGTDVFSVNGGASNVSPSNPTGRIRAVLSPKSVASSPGTGAPPAVLLPSNGLGGDKK